MTATRPGTTVRSRNLAILLAAALITLAGCSSPEPESPAPTSDAAYNAADVSFATEMIPHHAQALQMVDLTIGRTLDPEIQGLADSILAAQGPEIETMTTWLTDWGQPIPMTARDHANAGSGEEMHSEMSDMPGMMSAAEMTALQDATDEEFETLWLTSMIRHHEGAIEMADVEQAKGKFPDAVALAATISAGQAAEIDKMKSLLDR